MNEISTTSSTESTKAVQPADDRVTEEVLFEKLAEHDLERVVAEEDVMSLKDEYQSDARMGERWSMQKAMCLLWTDYPGDAKDGGITVLEVAYLIDTWFEKPNYGVARAQTDLKKFIGRRFACQNENADGEAAAA